MDVVSRSQRKTYMKMARTPLYEAVHAEDHKEMRLHRKLLLEKCYTSASMNLKENILNSDISEKYNIKSSKSYKVQDLSKYKTLIESCRTESIKLQPATAHPTMRRRNSTLTRSMPQIGYSINSSSTVFNRQVTVREQPEKEREKTNTYKIMVSEEDGTIIELTNNFTMNKLCDTLRDKGLGDPRCLFRVQPPDPLPLLRKQFRHERKYPFYQQKLKGKALFDTNTVNRKAMAFIEQQKESEIKQTRTASANWRDRFQMLNFRDNSEAGFSREEGDNLDDHNFATWDEDSKPHTLSDQMRSKIDTWITDVQEAISAA